MTYVAISEKDSITFIIILIAAKNFYYRILRERLEDQNINEQRDYIFITLHIKLYCLMLLTTVNSIHHRNHSLVNKFVVADIQILLISYSFKDGKVLCLSIRMKS